MSNNQIINNIIIDENFKQNIESINNNINLLKYKINEVDKIYSIVYEQINNSPLKNLENKYNKQIFNFDEHINSLHC